jgi:hypothetical protein
MKRRESEGGKNRNKKIVMVKLIIQKTHTQKKHTTKKCQVPGTAKSSVF